MTFFGRSAKSCIRKVNKMADSCNLNYVKQESEKIMSVI